MKLTLALFTAMTAMAAPVMFPDGVRVDSNDPRIGQLVGMALLAAAKGIKRCAA